MVLILIAKANLQEAMKTEECTEEINPSTNEKDNTDDFPKRRTMSSCTIYTFLTSELL